MQDSEHCADAHPCHEAPFTPSSLQYLLKKAGKVHIRSLGELLRLTSLAERSLVSSGAWHKAHLDA